MDTVHQLRGAALALAFELAGEQRAYFAQLLESVERRLAEVEAALQ